MTAHKDRQRIVESINQAVTQGARKYKACETIGLEIRTLQRWVNDDTVNDDKRPKAKRPEPANKLTEQEKQAILMCCNRAEFSHLSPNQIVPKLADQGEYLASESSFTEYLKTKISYNTEAETGKRER